MIIIKYKSANITFAESEKGISVLDFDKKYPKLPAPRDLVYFQLTGKEYKKEVKKEIKEDVKKDLKK